MALTFEKTRILIWGKTYPELSWGHQETVCTGGCDESGKPMRLYPVPLRYLPDDRQYSLYHWIEAPIARSTRDTRPESYKVRPDKISLVRKVGTANGWAERRRTIFADPSWRYGCVNDLRRSWEQNHTSLGLVRASDIDRIRVKRRSDEDRQKHEAKLSKLKQMTDLFGYDQRDLEFFPWRMELRWRCERVTGKQACPGHTMVVLDWGLGELGRKAGPEKARQKMEEISNVTTHDLWFFIGNFKQHPQNFGIVGVWYPLKRHMQQADLFLSS